jgi:predicted enzyme related to lactoylglutathione lyase
VLAAVARLTAAGATVVREDLQDGVPDHFVMADPEGNEFCVV